MDRLCQWIGSHSALVVTADESSQCAGSHIPLVWEWLPSLPMHGGNATFPNKRTSTDTLDSIDNQIPELVKVESNSNLCMALLGTWFRTS